MNLTIHRLPTLIEAQEADVGIFDLQKGDDPLLEERRTLK
jgi:hypothetical protein